MSSVIFAAFACVSKSWGRGFIEGGVYSRDYSKEDSGCLIEGKEYLIEKSSNVVTVAELR